MLLKWIICSIPQELHMAFSEAQRKWTALKAQPGFLGQVGGWNINLTHQAGILSCWQDEASYQHFMQHVHDDLFQRSRQKGTYTSIVITLFRETLSIPGLETDFISALSWGSVLRVTDSHVFPERAQAFIQNQITVWNPGMAQSGGMQGGVCAQAQENPSRYLVASLWSDLQAHQTYLQTIFPSLREKANLPHTIKHIEGWVMQLEKSWQVIPESVVRNVDDSNC